MFAFCQNPDCRAPFEYKKGRLFRFRQSAAEGPANPRSHGVKHFWLCEACSKTHTLDYLEGSVLLLRRSPTVTEVREPTEWEHLRPRAPGPSPAASRAKSSAKLRR